MIPSCSALVHKEDNCSVLGIVKKVFGKNWPGMSSNCELECAVPLKVVAAGAPERDGMTVENDDISKDGKPAGAAIPDNVGIGFPNGISGAPPPNKSSSSLRYTPALPPVTVLLEFKTWLPPNGIWTDAVDAFGIANSFSPESNPPIRSRNAF